MQNFEHKQPKQKPLLQSFVERNKLYCVWEKTLHDNKKENKLKFINILHIQTFDKGDGCALKMSRLAMYKNYCQH